MTNYLGFCHNKNNKAVRCPIPQKISTKPPALNLIKRGDSIMPHITVTKCSECPFARHLDGDRYVCTDSATASDVKRGHWEISTDCIEKLEPRLA